MDRLISLGTHVAVGQNQWDSMLGYTTHLRTYFSGYWDVHWGCGLLTLGHVSAWSSVPTRTRRGYAGVGPCFHLPGFHFGNYRFLSHIHVDGHANTQNSAQRAPAHFGGHLRLRPARLVQAEAFGKSARVILKFAKHTKIDHYSSFLAPRSS